MTRRAAIAALALAAFAQARGEWVTEVVTNYNVPASYFYVRGGLISQWDGIDNAGFGVHNASATTWKDLQGGNNLTISGGAWTDKSLKLTNGRAYRATAITCYTVELLWIPKQTGWSGGVCINGGSPMRYFYVQTANFIMTHDYNGIYSASSLLNKTIYTASVYGSSFVGYLNGAVATSTYNDYWGQDANMVNFGSRRSGTGTGEYLACRVYSRALTAAEIAHNYELDNYRFMGGATPSFPLYVVTTNRVYRAPAPMRSFDAAHPFNNAAARTRLGGTGSGEDGTTLRPSAHFAIKKNEED